MKILLVAVVLLVAIEEWTEAHPQGWRTYSGFQNERGNNPGYGSPWAQQMENNGFSSEIEWVCQNPRTKDMMIIASDDTQHTPQYHPNRGPWWQRLPHNVPPGHQKKENSDGNYWIEVKPTSQETSNTDRTQIPFVTTTEIPNNNRQTCTTQPAPHYHGGEGSIDIRVGE